MSLNVYLYFQCISIFWKKIRRKHIKLLTTALSKGVGSLMIKTHLLFSVFSILYYMMVFFIIFVISNKFINKETYNTVTLPACVRCHGESIPRVMKHSLAWISLHENSSTWGRKKSSTNAQLFPVCLWDIVDFRAPAHTSLCTLCLILLLYSDV